jgi:sugar/nucleoside kinase (ribokinase family)
VDTLAFVDEDFIREHDLTKGQMTLVDAQTQARLLHALNNHELELRSGGSAANTMIGLARSGGTGFYTGKVSRDPNGEFYRQDLVEAGIHFDVHPTPEEDLPTATCIVFTTPDAERTMFTHLGVSTDLTSDDIDEDRLKQCKYSYAEGYLWTGDGTKEATLTTFQYSKKHDLKIALSFSDPGLVAHVRDDFFYLTREYVDVVFCNADEARKFADMENVEEAAKVIGELAEMAFITDGKDGAIAVSEGNIQRVEGFNVNAVDTNGAGDNFASGVLYGLTHGYDPVKAARWGNYLASRVVQVHGARIEQNLKDQIPEILG